MRPLRQPGQSRIAALGRSAVCSAARATRSRRRVACRPGRAAGRCRPYRRRQGCDRRSVPTAPARPAGRTAAAAVQRRRHDGGSPACDGGDGCISVTANVMPGLCAHMHAAWVDGNLDRFAELRDALAPLHEALFAETNPIPVKAALELLGLCDAHARAPLCRAAETTRARLATVITSLRSMAGEASSGARRDFARPPRRDQARLTLVR